MDPVNKWLTTIIIFMAAVVIVIAWKAGSGRYDVVVEVSQTIEAHSVVYVVDTKSGAVFAKLVDENDLQHNGVTNKAALKIFKIP